MDSQEQLQHERQSEPFMLQFLERVDAHPSGDFSDDPTYAGATPGNGPDFHSD